MRSIVQNGIRPGGACAGVNLASSTGSGIITNIAGQGMKFKLAYQSHPEGECIDK